MKNTDVWTLMFAVVLTGNLMVASLAAALPEDAAPVTVYEELDKTYTQKKVQTQENMKGIFGEGSLELPDTMDETKLRATESAIGDDEETSDGLPSLNLEAHAESVSAVNPVSGYTDTRDSTLTTSDSDMGSALFTGFIVANLADGAAGKALMDTRTVTELKLQSIMQMEQQFISSMLNKGDQASMWRLQTYYECKKGAVKAGGASAEGLNQVEPVLACLQSGMNGGGTRAAITRKGAATKGIKTRAEELAGGTGGTGAAGDTAYQKFVDKFGPELMEKATTQCQLANLPSYDEAELCEPEAEDAAKYRTVDGPMTGVGLKLSAMMFGKDSDLTGKALRRKKEWQETFGDMCYFCAAGDEGGTENSLYKFYVRPRIGDDFAESLPISQAKVYTNVELRVFELLRDLMHHRCYKDNSNQGTAPATQQIEGVFRLNSAGTCAGSDVATGHEDGAYWANCQTKFYDLSEIGGDEVMPIEDVLASLSFPGFDLTPAILNNVYSLVSAKNRIGDLTEIYPDGYEENPSCDYRFGRDSDFVYEKTREAIEKNLFLPREVKALFFLARKISLGKVYAAGDVIVKKILRDTKGASQYAEDALLVIARGLSADSVEGYRVAEAVNRSELIAFVDRLNSMIAEESGKSGASMAKAFNPYSGSNQPK